MSDSLETLRAVLRIPRYRVMGAALSVLYLVLFLLALQDLSVGGSGVRVLTTDWERMFDRTGTFTFEPIAQFVVPGLTLLVSPLNILLGLALSILAGLNLVLTYIAFRQPAACSFNRSSGVLASLPALMAGGACCAPAIVLILGLQVSSLMIGVFQVLIPVSLVLLVLTLKLILDRTDPSLLSR